MRSIYDSPRMLYLILNSALQTTTLAAPHSSLNVGPSIIEVPQRWNDVFPAADFNRLISEPIWNITLSAHNSRAGLQSDLDTLRNASFVAYNPGFYDLLGVSSYEDQKVVEELFEFPSAPSYAQRQIHDATVYSPDCDCIFFNQMYSPKEGESFPGVDYVWRVNNVTSADQSNVKVEKVYPHPRLRIPNGAYYHNGSVYWADEGDVTHPGGLVRMDPVTLETEVVLNNYYGRRFNSPNDVVITNGGIAFFTDGYYGYENFNSTISPEQANGIWR